MKTYGYYLILHILGLTGLIIAGVLAMLHGLWFCTIICGLLLIGICYSLNLCILHPFSLSGFAHLLPTRRCRS